MSDAYEIPGVTPNWLEEMGLFKQEEFNPYQEWQGMPEFEQEAYQEYKQLLIRFDTKEDYQVFAQLIGQNLTEQTKSIWYPERPEQISDQRGTQAGLIYSEEIKEK